MTKGVNRISIVAAAAAGAFVAAHPALGAPNPRAAALQALGSDSVRPLVQRAGRAEGRQFVVGRVPVSKFSTAERRSDQGRAFWREYGAAFGVRDPGSELALRSVKRDALGMTHVRYDQRYRGLEVFGRRLLLHFKNEAVSVVNGDFAQVGDLATTPRVARTGAEWAATMAIPVRGTRETKTPATLLVYVDGGGVAHLAWRARVASTRPLGFWQVFVDALTGQVLRAYDDLQTARNRNTYDAINLTLLPGTLRFTEAGCFAPPCDSVVTATHANTAFAYDYFGAAHGRDSFNAGGAAINSTAHYGFSYNNAFWCSTCAGGLTNLLVYGDGDGVAFSPLGADQDIVVHEFGHGVTAHTANLTYVEQSGAVNESVSDIWAAMADNDGNEWLVGENSRTPAVPGDALRSMIEPTAYGQPSHVSQYRHTAYDNGGVHINSGIPNRAAYLVATDPGYGIGRANTQRIYYRALTAYLTPSSDFLALLNALTQSAVDLFGGGSPQVRAVIRAHAVVGLVTPPAVISPNGGGVLPGGAAATIQWNPGETGLPVAIDLVQDSGSTVYSQGFAGGPALPPGFSTAGHVPWFVDPASQVARSGPIGNNQRTEMSFTAKVTAPTSVTFRVSVNSEFNFDFFTFYVDGVLRLFGSGSIPLGAAPPVPVSAGSHTFTFVYETDFAITPLNHGVIVDDFVIPNAENVSVTNIVPATSPGQSSLNWTLPPVSGPNFRIRVRYPNVPALLASDDSDNLFGIDSAAPVDPRVTSGSHRVGVASRDNTVDVAFSGASDAVSGVDGFSYQWDRAAGSVPDTVKDAEENAGGTTSPALPDGRHYFHLRTRDNVGHWSAAVHAGPFVISRRRGARVVRCVVPRLRGKTVAQARRLLAARRCRLGKVTRRPSSARRKRVVRQSRRPGARLPRATRVNIVVR